MKLKITEKSKYFAGIPKNLLLKKLFEMKVNSFHFPDNFTIEQKIDFILKLVRNCK